MEVVIVKNKFDIKSAVADYAIMLAGAAVYAVSVVVFTAPNDIAPGGLTGVATMLNHMFGLPIGTMVLIMNIPLFIWGAIENGISFLTKTIAGTVFASILIDVFTPIMTAYTGDRILVAIFGGILNGVGLEMIFMRGGSTGGTDIVALNLHKHFPYFSTGNLIFAADALVLVMAFFVYNSIESVLYAVVTIFFSIKVIDTISYGVARDNGKLMFIITDKYKEICSMIMTENDRGITLLNGEGAYSGKPKRVIMCAVRPHQVYKITNTVKSVDKRAFIIVTTAGSIKGKGFITKTGIGS